MTNSIHCRRVWKTRFAYLVAVALLATQPSLAQNVRQESFPTPEDAFVALVDAVQAGDVARLKEILGPEAEGAIGSGDEVADRRGRELFVAAYYQSATLSGDGNEKTLSVGSEEWPFPIPVVNAGGKWRFDTTAGIRELLYRRIGRNELATIQVCRSYYEAQKEYASKPHDGNPSGVYAQKIASSPGKQDGLFWEVKEGDELSPFGDLMAQAAAEGYTRTENTPIPYHGYYFRILNAQGSAAPGGAKSFISDGQMRGGFALVAYPAEYQKGGVMTFIVSHDGIVHEKNLGPETEKIASGMKEYNPDTSWHRAW